MKLIDIDTLLNKVKNRKKTTVVSLGNLTIREALELDMEVRNNSACVVTNKNEFNYRNRLIRYTINGTV